MQVDKDGFYIPLVPVLTPGRLNNFTSKHQDLKQFLHKNGGSHILNEYDENGILSDRTRRDLVNLTEIFYDDSQKTPSGYLAWRLRTVMRSRGNIRKRKCDDGIENRVPFKKPKNIEISTEEERDIEFLKNSNYKTQKEEIFKKMKSTINVRKQRNFTLDDFPRFLDTDGLIHQDFNLLYPDSCPFAPKFEKYLDIIFKVYDKTACSKSSLVDGTVSGWNKPTRALLALLHMLPATAKGKKVGRRDSFESSVDKLLIFCTTWQDTKTKKASLNRYINVTGRVPPPPVSGESSYVEKKVVAMAIL
ncbi:unnamed protein product [Ceutorhynchus assimilis]|uniref:Uncharacterized protein n=1 Tax=Ceutorhynchus assimilis TaxID=467358 RepID=A0A9N9N251_9CUCU|nr:unnamed protein product [Ceutorhynchus assimilis]